jgi:hypothetical protein
MPTLKTYYGGGIFSQQINDLAFAFITPLSAQYNDEFSHVSLAQICQKMLVSFK